MQTQVDWSTRKRRSIGPQITLEKLQSEVGKKRRSSVGEMNSTQTDFKKTSSQLTIKPFNKKRSSIEPRSNGRNSSMLTTLPCSQRMSKQKPKLGFDRIKPDDLLTISK